jgi:methionyl-tRNA formyltransferase
MTGDSQTGVDVMRMDAGLDTGPIAIREVIPILPDETAGDLTSRLAAIAAELGVSALRSMEAGLLEFREQSEVGICYARKIKKSEAEIDWTQSRSCSQSDPRAVAGTGCLFERTGTRPL